MAEIQGWECTIKADGTPKMYPAVLGTYVTRADYLAAVEKLEAEIKGYELQDGMLRKAYEDSGDAERFTWSGWLLKLVRDNAALEAEVQALREKLTQRSAPVSDEEWQQWAWITNTPQRTQLTDKISVNRLIAARTAPKEGKC